jgi:urea transport system ATP-binding protein
MLSVEGLNQAYGESQILWDMKLDVPEGSSTCLMGRNGVGKSTFLRVVMGTLKHRSGKVSFAGEDLAGRPPELRARRGIGYVPQGREIFPQLTVRENLELGVVASGRKRKLPERVMSLFPVLKTMLNRRGGDLSGGQQQQLAIGRALALNPYLLILDEPTEGIQPSIIKDIENVIRTLARQGRMAILLVEQYYDFARSLADQYLLMERGEIVQRGSGEDMDADGVRQRLAV